MTTTKQPARRDHKGRVAPAGKTAAQELARPPATPPRQAQEPDQGEPAAAPPAKRRPPARK